MNSLYGLCAFMVSVSLWPLAGSTPAQESESPIEVSPLWKTFSVTNANEVSCITPGQGGLYWAAGNTYSKSEGESHWWGQLNAAGKRIRQVRDWDSRGFRNSKVVALQQAADQSIWVVGERIVSKFKPDGNQVFSRSVFEIAPQDRFSVSISAALATEDDGVLLSGLTRPTRDEMDAWLLKIDAKGNRAWEKSFDYGKHEWILHANRKKDHYVLVAISGKSDKFGAGFDGLGVIECNERGEKIREHLARGSISPDAKPSLVTADGHVVVAYSKTAFPMRDAWLVCLDSLLKPVWDKRIAEPQLTAFTPCVSLADERTIVMTWNGPRDCRLWQLDERGKHLSDKSYPGARGFYVREPAGGGRLFLQKIGNR